MNPYVLLGAAIVAELFGTSALNASEGFTRPLPTLGVLVGYAISFYLLSGTSSLNLRVHPSINGQIISTPDRNSVQDVECVSVISEWGFKSLSELFAIAEHIAQQHD